MCACGNSKGKDGLIFLQRKLGVYFGSGQLCVFFVVVVFNIRAKKN